MFFSSLVPLYPESGYDFWTKKETNLIFLDSARSAIWLIARHYRHHLFLIPSYTCPSVWKTLEQVGVEYDFVDLDEALDFDQDDLAKMIQKYSDREIVLIPTSLVGVPLRNYKELLDGIVILEDRAQGMLDMGSLADFQILSFGKGKMVSGFGGGAVLDRHGYLQDALSSLKTQGGFAYSFVMAIAQKVISRCWFLIEGTGMDPEKANGFKMDRVEPKMIDGLKKQWILNSMATANSESMKKNSEYYLEHIDTSCCFQLPKGVAYMRFPVKKALARSGVSRMPDYHLTYELAIKKRGREMPGAKKLVKGCFLPTHRLVNRGDAQQLVEEINEPHV